MDARIMLAVVAIFASRGASGKTMNLTECNGNNTDPLITLNSYSFVPFPINSPGALTVSVTATINRPLPVGGLSMKVLLQREILFDIRIPCSHNVGSCTYDVCDLLDTFKNTSCPKQLIDNNIPCTCDTLVPGTYSLVNQTFNVPDITLLTSWSSLALGDYRVRFDLLDSETGEEVYCLGGLITVKDPNACSGFLCSIFGRRSLDTLNSIASYFWSWFS